MTKATEMLTELQGQLNLRAHKLINNYPMRWNSNFICSKNKNQYYGHFRELSSKQGVSCSKVVLLLDASLTELQRILLMKMRHKSLMEMKHSQEASIPILQKRVSSIDWVYGKKMVYSVWILLDPRCALHWLEQKLSLMRLASVDTAKCYICDQGQWWKHLRSSSEKEKVIILMKNFKKEGKTSIYIQVNRSLRIIMNWHYTLELEPLIEKKILWSGGRKQFPILAELTCEYLAIRVMSTPSERSFAAAGYISSQRRSCLIGEHVTIHFNYY